MPQTTENVTGRDASQRTAAPRAKHKNKRNSKDANIGQRSAGDSKSLPTLAERKITTRAPPQPRLTNLQCPEKKLPVLGTEHLEAGGQHLHVQRRSETCYHKGPEIPQSGTPRNAASYCTVHTPKRKHTARRENTTNREPNFYGSCTTPVPHSRHVRKLSTSTAQQ